MLISIFFRIFCYLWSSTVETSVIMTDDVSSNAGRIWMMLGEQALFKCPSDYIDTFLGTEVTLTIMIYWCYGPPVFCFVTLH